MSAVDDQVETLICEVERLKKESSDWKAKARENLSLFHDIEPKYISLVQESTHPSNLANTSNAIYVHKIQMLEEIVTSERNKNISLIDRAHKAEEDVKTLQITFEEMKERAEELESKLISAAVLESQNASLKEQIEEVREERNRIYESVDRVVREKNEEIARLGFKIEDVRKDGLL
jgi:chromosome segregation ATPase